MYPQWRLRDAMATVAVIGIYLAALGSLTRGPSGDAFVVWQQLLAIVLLFFVMPFHIMAAWSRCTTRKGE
jgi:hypothetical protein